MAKMFALCQMAGGYPAVDPLQVGKDYFGHVHMDSLGGFGAYLFSGTAIQLSAVNALANVVGIVGVTDTGGAHWAELDGVISAGVRTNLNTWLTNHGQATVPAGRTYRQVINAVYQHFNTRFDVDTNGVDVTDV